MSTLMRVAAAVTPTPGDVNTGVEAVSGQSSPSTSWVLLVVPVLAWLLLLALAAVFTYRDASKRFEGSAAAITLAVVVTSPVGFVVYLLYTAWQRRQQEGAVSSR